MTMNQHFTFPWQLTLRYLIEEGCGIAEDVGKNIKNQ